MRALIPTLLFAVSAIADDADKLKYFETHVRPVLVEHCYECHANDSKSIKGGLLLDSRLGWQIGGDSGPAIVPGDPDNSLLITAVHYMDGDLKMPPKYQLSESTVKHLRRWIKAGAFDPREGDVSKVSRSEIDLEAGRKFWSFQPVRSPQAPDVRSSQWPQDDIDRFILARLEAEKLEPAAQASRRTLIRRASYDLTGLPPTPAEIADFLADDKPEAFARVIDRMLASEEFGEHWGRHWLDVARYAESSGGGRSLMFPEAWRFRDYVIAALNADKPFDQFIREQIAGDLLPWDNPEQRNEQLTASAYLVLGPTNYELQDKATLEMDVIDEQIDTIGRGFLGMSIGCARCHDHKFDPVPTADYYALAGIFNSTDILTAGNVSGWTKRTLERLSPITDEEKTRDEKIASLTKALRSAEDRLGPIKNPDARKGIDPATIAGIVMDDREAEKVGRWQNSTHTPRWVGEGYIHDSHGAGGPAKVIFRPRIERGGTFDVRVSYSSNGNRANNALVIIDHADGRSEKRINQTLAPPIHGTHISVGSYRFEADTAIAITLDNNKAGGVLIVDSIQLLPEGVEDLRGDALPVADGDLPLTKPKRKELADTVKRLNKELTELKKKAKYKPVQVMAAKDSAKPEDGHVHIRGGVRNLGPKVPRGFLRVAMSAKMAELPPEIPDGSSGRLELANWIASADNPLTARVTVNRIWHHLFGRGLVRTVDNFGQTGEAPSHPELLDFLATRFMEDSWSLKTTIRQMMLSRSYQMAASGYAGMAADPENILLWRARRQRLSAEALRDGILAVSGELDPARGGRTIRKLSQYDHNYPFDTVRRSVYVPTFRNSILPLFEMFDAANPNLVVGARNASNLPTQALYLMNSPFVLEQSKKAAARLIAEQKPEARLDHLYQHALGRLPRPDERQLAEAHLASFGDAESAAWTSICHSLYACVDFRFID